MSRTIQLQQKPCLESTRMHDDCTERRRVSRVLLHLEAAAGCVYLSLQLLLDPEQARRLARQHDMPCSGHAMPCHDGPLSGHKKGLLVPYKCSPSAQQPEPRTNVQQALFSEPVWNFWQQEATLGCPAQPCGRAQTSLARAAGAGVMRC